MLTQNELKEPFHMSRTCDHTCPTAVNGKPGELSCDQAQQGIQASCLPISPRLSKAGVAGQQGSPGAEGTKEDKGELLLILRVKLSNEGDGKKANQC